MYHHWLNGPVRTSEPALLPPQTQLPCVVLPGLNLVGMFNEEQPSSFVRRGLSVAVLGLPLESQSFLHDTPSSFLTSSFTR